MNRVLLVGGVGDGQTIDCLPGSATVVFGSPEGVSIYECSSARFVFAEHSMSITVGVEHQTPRNERVRLIASALFSKSISDDVSEGRIKPTPTTGVRSRGVEL